MNIFVFVLEEGGRRKWVQLRNMKLNNLHPSKIFGGIKWEYGMGRDIAGLRGNVFVILT
jgi:hypothetical protein